MNSSLIDLSIYPWCIWIKRARSLIFILCAATTHIQFCNTIIQMYFRGGGEFSPPFFRNCRNQKVFLRLNYWERDIVKILNIFLVCTLIYHIYVVCGSIWTFFTVFVTLNLKRKPFLMVSWHIPVFFRYFHQTCNLGFFPWPKICHKSLFLF